MMIRFLFKGLLRDRNRSILPITVVAIGVAITVFMHAYLGGVMGESLEKSAAFNTGHLRIETQAYAENASQMPIDLALIDVDLLKSDLEEQYSGVRWVARIGFGGLLDAPDSLGSTRVQGNVMGMAFNLLETSDEKLRMELPSLLKQGRFPEKRGEMLMSDELFVKMNLHLGDVVTVMSTTMFGEMAMYNFTVAGTLHFGVNAMDKGMIMVDLEDARLALNMEDVATQLLGFFDDELYDNRKAMAIAADFNSRHTGQSSDEFTPVMSPLSEANIVGMSYTTINNLSTIILVVFLLAMSIVLWNTGLISGLRRYGEFGLRLAIGEHKREIYRSLIWEAVLVGIVGSIIGTFFGLIFSWLLQTYGIDITNISQDSNMMIANVIRARITTTTYFVGFIPGLVSTVLGAMLAGVGIYKRQTAKLFKELEN